MSERRERGGETKRRERGIGEKEAEGTLLISLAPPQPLNPGDATGDVGSAELSQWAPSSN